MVTIHLTRSIYIITDPNNEVDVKHFNTCINQFLESQNQLNSRDKFIERCVRVKDDVCVSPYGPLKNKMLGTFVKHFLESQNIEYTLDLDTEYKVTDTELKKTVSMYRSYRGTSCGGITKDTPGIDPNVQNILNAVNMFDGIKTFSSCEGHTENGSGNFYFLMTAENLKSLNNLMFILDKSLSKVWERYTPADELRPQLLIDYGHWEQTKGVYFEFRLPYDTKHQELVWDMMDHLAKLVECDFISGVIPEDTYNVTNG